MSYIFQGIEQTFEEIALEYEGVKVWNAVPMEIRNKISINSFRNKHEACLNLMV